MSLPRICFYNYDTILLYVLLFINSKLFTMDAFKEFCKKPAD